MILAIDVGNSNLAMGVYEGEKLVQHWRLSTTAQATSDDLGIAVRTLMGYNGFSCDRIEAVVYATVVPPLVRSIEEMSTRYLGVAPLKVGPGTRTGINIKYQNPREVGPDRIANAVAAEHLFGGPCLVVDFGTATTFDVISSEGDYAGGVILPGVGISSEALFERAARLPRVDLYRPERTVGKNTADSIRSGIVNGYAGSVDAIVAKIARECGSPRRVIATGGWAGVIAPECESVDEVDPYLTLEGLRIIYLRNQTCQRGGAHG